MNWLPRVREALSTLDLVVFVPLERLDRVPLGPGEDPELRDAVDRQLTEMLLQDSLDLDLEVVSVEGSREDRVAQVLQRIG